MELRLSNVRVGRRVKLVSINGGRQLKHRLRALGLSVGDEFDVLHHRGGGVVVGKNGNRVALGGSIAEKLMIEERD